MVPAPHTRLLDAEPRGLARGPCPHHYYNHHHHKEELRGPRTSARDHCRHPAVAIVIGILWTAVAIMYLGGLVLHLGGGGL
jgi:hypothetical protein